MSESLSLVLVAVCVLLVLRFFMSFLAAPAAARAGGAPAGALAGKPPRGLPPWRPNPDEFSTVEEVTRGLRDAGLEAAQLIVAVDFTKSNEYSGQRTWDPVRSMHDTHAGRPNPYQRVIAAIGRTLEPLDDDKLIDCFGFGDSATKGTGCFPFWPDGRPAYGCEEALTRYAAVAADVVLSGPTNFAPVIRRAVALCRERREYHILVIVADGQVTSVAETRAAVVEAARTALSVVIVGVGDGPFDEMHLLDDGLEERAVDNVQFLQFRDGMTDAQFALAALMEIPAQFRAFKQAGLI